MQIAFGRVRRKTSPARKTVQLKPFAEHVNHTVRWVER